MTRWPLSLHGITDLHCYTFSVHLPAVMLNTEGLSPNTASHSYRPDQPGPQLWHKRLSRRTALKMVAGAAISSGAVSSIAAGRGKEDLQFEVSRFMMKGDRPRLELRTRHFRFI